MNEIQPAEPLRLDRVAGPAVEIQPIQPGSHAVIGRSEGCDIALVEETVSRRHASLKHHGSHWVIEDMGSRHGTYLNGVKLVPGRGAALGEGDLIRIGPWILRASITGKVGSFTATFDDSTSQSQRIERVSAEHTARLAQHRLDLLIECAGAISGAKNERELADTALHSALMGSGFERGALLRRAPGSSDVEVIGQQMRDGSHAEDFTFSRSLLREAASGQMARLSTEQMPAAGQSIVELNITAAICAPVMVGEAIAAFLYLDARGGAASGGGGHVVGDAAGFCHVIARLCGLALLNIKRQEMEDRQRRLEQEVSAAREAQILILPADEGEIGPLRYAMRMRPGRFVAGDLFDVVRLTDDRVAVLIGDVTGEGVGSAMLMVAAQSHVHAALQQHGDAAAAVNIVNRYLAGRCGFSKFISMWVGIFDLTRGSVSYVDAGHGHWLHKPAASSGTAEVKHTGGIPVGIDDGFEYHAEELNIAPGDRLVLYSDGVTEQRSPEDEQFGKDRVIALLNRCASAEEDVRTIIAAVDSFAGRSDLADDTTVASIEWKANPNSSHG